MTESLTQNLVETAQKPVPQALRQRAVSHVLDWAACALLGATSPPGRALGAYGCMQSAGDCPAIGVGRVAPQTAAFVNGGLGNIFEIDDIHRTSIVHPGDTVIPAALAAASLVGTVPGDTSVGGDRLLDAIVRGYEVAIRIGAAAGSGHYAHWYNTATCGVFGAAMAAADLMALPAEAQVDALGQAGMQATGLWQCRLEPTFSKQLATARAAQSGVIAAELARIGFPGPRQILEGPLGFFAATSPDAYPAEVLTGTGADWRMEEVSFKPWPACRHAHPVIDAALALREKHRGASPNRTSSGAEFSRAHVTTYRAAVDFCDDPHPDTPHRARFSLQHCLALAWLRGQCRLADFEPDQLQSPDIAALRGKISVSADERMTAAFPGSYCAEVDLTFPDGSTASHTVTDAKGDPENPLSTADLEAKWTDMIQYAGTGSGSWAPLVDAASRLTTGETTEAFMDALDAVSARLPEDGEAVAAGADLDTDGSGRRQHDHAQATG